MSIFNFALQIIGKFGQPLPRQFGSNGNRQPAMVVHFFVRQFFAKIWIKLRNNNLNVISRKKDYARRKFKYQ